MGYDLEGVDEDGSNGAGSWDDAKGSGTYSAAVLKKKLSGEGGDVEDPGGVSPPGRQTNFGDDGKTCSGWDMGIYRGVGGARSSRLIPHTGFHLEMVGNHYGTGEMPPHI